MCMHFQIMRYCIFLAEKCWWDSLWILGSVKFRSTDWLTVSQNILMKFHRPTVSRFDFVNMTSLLWLIELVLNFLNYILVLVWFRMTINLKKFSSWLDFFGVPSLWGLVDFRIFGRILLFHWYPFARFGWIFNSFVWEKFFCLVSIMIWRKFVF